MGAGRLDLGGKDVGRALVIFRQRRARAAGTVASAFAPTTEEGRHGVGAAPTSPRGGPVGCVGRKEGENECSCLLAGREMVCWLWTVACCAAARVVGAAAAAFSAGIAVLAALVVVPVCV